MKISPTALIISKAHIFLSFSEKVSPLIDPKALEASEWCVDRWIDGKPGTYKKQCKNPFYRSIIETAQSVLGPGHLTHYILRKNIIHDMVKAAIDDGVKQVINVGAGLDTLFYRLNKPEVAWIELDLPELQSFKKELLAELPIAPPKFEAHPIDLEDDPIKPERFTHFNEGEKTLTLMEGVSMYLDQAAIESTFQSAASYSPAGSYFIFTFCEPEYEKKNVFLKLWLKLRSEPYKWTATKAEVDGLLAKFGWKSEAFYDFREMQRNIYSDQHVQKMKCTRADHIVLARRV